MSVSSLHSTHSVQTHMTKTRILPFYTIFFLLFHRNPFFNAICLKHDSSTALQGWIVLIIFYRKKVSIIVILSCDQFYGGSISEGSELQIEVAEFFWRNVQVLPTHIDFVNLYGMELLRYWADICGLPLYSSSMEAWL